MPAQLSDLYILPQFWTAYANGITILFHDIDMPLKAKLPDGTIVGWSSPSHFREWADANLPGATVQGAAVKRECGYVWRSSPALDLSNPTDFGRAIDMLNEFLQPTPLADAIEKPTAAVAIEVTKPTPNETVETIAIRHPFSYDTDQTREVNRENILRALTLDLEATSYAIGCHLLASQETPTTERIYCAQMARESAYYSACAAGIVEQEARTMADNLHLKIWLMVGVPAGSA